VGDVLSLGDDQRLQITVQTVESIRRIDPKTPLVVSFDQPWGEYMTSDERELTPMQFADTLVRADLGLSGICLEINLGYHPGGTLPRDELQFSQVIDRWSAFGLPLLVALTVPSGASPDANARQGVQVFAGSSRNTADAESQRVVAQRLVPLLLAKQAVQAVFWNQLADAAPHDFPHGGLLDTTGAAKPALEVLRLIRREHLV
jgi:hypothetical protein